MQRELDTLILSPIKKEEREMNGFLEERFDCTIPEWGELGNYAFAGMLIGACLSIGLFALVGMAIGMWC